MGLIALCFV